MLALAFLVMNNHRRKKEGETLGVKNRGWLNRLNLFCKHKVSLEIGNVVGLVERRQRSQGSVCVSAGGQRLRFSYIQAYLAVSIFFFFPLHMLKYEFLAFCCAPISKKSTTFKAKRRFWSRRPKEPLRNRLSKQITTARLDCFWPNFKALH